MWSFDNITQLNSRLMLGTSLYPSPDILLQCIKVSETNVITASLSRQNPRQQGGLNFWEILKKSNCHILPNTAGCKTVDDAINMAQLAREIFTTNWIKLELIGDDYNLHPDSVLLLEATKELIKLGFEVLPYCTDDLVIAKKLVDCGCKVLMPGIAPIGSGQGILNYYSLKTLRNRFTDIILIADAGVGRPSDATILMELGFDAILLNSAVALATDPVQMSLAFKHAVESGFIAHHAGIIPKKDFAQHSTPLIDTPFWHT